MGKARTATDATAFLRGGGELGAMMRAKDWAQTPLGPAATWPQSLKTAVRIMLTSRQPIWIGWGPQLIKLYNDPYKAIVGGKHPQALGQPAELVWREIWDEAGPRLRTALQGDQGTYDEALLLIMERNGYREETYYTFSYSPIPADDGGVGGIFCTNTDDTQRVVRERQLALLQMLAAGTAHARSEQEVFELATRCLERARRDLPFALIYRVASREAELVASAGIPAGHPAALARVDLGRDDAWPLAAALSAGEPVLIGDLASRHAGLPAEPWGVPPRQAIALPLQWTGAEHRAAVLVAGLNPLRPYDDASRDFVSLVRTQLEKSLAHAQAYLDERRRSEKLAEADRAKTAFFSNVSHEFRTPLTLLLGPLEDILETPEALPPPLRESLGIMQRNGRRLLKMVNSLLDFSRLEAGRAEAAYEALDLAQYTAELASQFRAAIEKAGLQLAVDCATLPEPVYVDREMWEKVVLNLLSNAFKHTFVGGIEVRVRAQDGQAVLSVRDTGIGIPAAALGHLFNRFYRVQGARGRTHEGTGIGLALVQELVRLHGGSVGVDSVVDTGSTFTVRLPFGHAHLDPARIGSPRRPPAAAGARPYVDEALRWDTAGGGIAPPRTAGPRPRIVLADDNADMRDYITRLLADDYDVVAVADGREALHAIVEERPALVLTDVMMPRLDGFGLLRAIRRNARLSSIPVIVLSARAGEDASSVGLDAGANDYLVKPFAARDLLARVAAQLAQARARDEALLRERALRDEAEGLNEVARELAAELDPQRLLDKVTEIATRLTGAAHGAFFHAGVDEHGGPRPLHTLSGAPREAFGALGLPRDTALFEATFRGAGPVRSGDIRKDPRYGHEAPEGSTPDQVPVVSYLAVPVVTRSGEVLGGLFFTHPEPDVFSARAERYAVGVAAQAAVALDNARLYRRLRSELAERERAESALRASEQLYRAIGESIDYGVWVADADGRNTYVSPSFLKLTGMTLEQCANEGWAAAVHPDEREPMLAAWRLCVRGGTAWDREFRLRGADGHWHPVLSRGVPVHDAEGRIGGWAGINLDFSRTKRIEEELREADRRKDEFLATLAHELRNPLAPLRNGLRIMRSAPDKAQLVHDAREMMERQLQQMVRLVDDLLDLSRISRGKIELRREVVDVEAVIRNAIETTRAVLEEGRHGIRLRLPPSPAYVDGDVTRLAQVVVNLLQNAAKYSTGGQSIGLAVDTTPGEVLISVSDEGAGIPADMLTRVFEMFTQIDRTLERSQGGLGIGLSIVKRLVELHGGRVEAHSEGPDRGSEFRVYLPRAPTPAARGDAPAAAGGPATHHLRVLVVDDNIDAAQSLATILQLEGCDTQITHDGRTALDLARSFLPDAVVLDIGLPQLSGYEVCRRLRRQPWGRDAVIIALTGWGQDEHRRRSHEAGFDHHLVKPVDTAMLSELLLALRRGASAPGRDAARRPPESA